MWGAEPTEERIVEAGKIMTAGGVSAGIDMVLPLAEALQLGIEYDPEPPFDAGSPKTHWGCQAPFKKKVPGSQICFGLGRGIKFELKP